MKVPAPFLQALRPWRRPPRKPTWPLLCVLLNLGGAVAAAPPEPGAEPGAAGGLDRARRLLAEGRVNAALATYAEVIAAGTDSEHVATAQNNTCLLLYQQGEGSRALPHCREALRLRRSQGDALRLARTLNNFALVLQSLGELEEAQKSFEEALTLNRRLGDGEGEVINLSNLAITAQQMGRYGEALEYLDAAEKRTAPREGGEKTTQSEPWAREQERIVRINRGTVLEKLGEYREALDLYRRLLAAEDLDPAQRAAVRLNLAVMYRNLGDPVRALEFFRETAALYEASGDRAALANVWLNVGIVHHLNLARPEAAEEAYRQAMQLAREAEDAGEEAQALLHLGRLLLDGGDLDGAETLFHECLGLTREAELSENRWSALDGLGRVARRRGELAAALAHFYQAIEAIEQVRSGLRQTSHREGFFGGQRAVYAAAVETLWQQQQAPVGDGEGAEKDPGAAAYALVQRVKSRELLESLESRALPARSLPSGALEAADVAARLGSGEFLREYFAGEEDLFAWTLRGGDSASSPAVTMHRLGPVRPVIEAAAAVQRAAAAGRQPPGERLHFLGESLLADLRQDLGRISGDEARLLIAPDEALHYLPFELLPVDSQGQETAEGQETLLERVTVSYLPSGSTLAWLGERRREPGRLLVGLGLPETPAAAPRMLRQHRLEPLPATAGELRTAGRRLRGEHLLLFGEEATEEALRQAVAPGARVVHLATHTVVEEGRQEGAAVLLAPSAGDDGLLFPREIAALDYRVELTVLAACRTALGPARDARSLTSLTGSFLAAGSSAVLATLWDVGDEATAVFMEQFYHQLARGHSPARALREVKLHMHRDPNWNDPGLWAAYVLIGDADPVVHPRFAWLPPLLTLLGAAGLAVWGWRRRRL